MLLDLKHTYAQDRRIQYLLPEVTPGSPLPLESEARLFSHPMKLAKHFLIPV